MHRSSILIVSFLLAARAGAASSFPGAETELFSLERASLKEILNIKTFVASVESAPLRETPGLVTVITGGEIASSGARDLIDVLRQVPEFEFGVDVQGNLGLGVKGNWANEGKTLLLWDGQPYNDMAYSTLQLLRFPVEQIERVEIIRGPGSAIYGGLAELAVINIITRGQKNFSGNSVYGKYGQTAGGYARRAGGYSFGRVYGQTSVSAQFFASGSQLSDSIYRDFSGNSYHMNGNSGMNARSLNLFVSNGGLNARLLIDDYYMKERDHFDTLLTTGATKVQFPLRSFDLSYGLNAAENLTLVTRFYLQDSRPWKEIDEHFAYDKSARRYFGGLTALYAPSSKTDIRAGAEFYQDRVEVGRLTAAGSSYANGGSGRSYDNSALFGEAGLDLDIVRLTAGGRYDHNSRVGASFVPRLALTRLYNDFHFKAIYSQAFRSPSVENIRLSPGIKAERTTATEFETGYQASRFVFVSANVFETAIKRPIIYYYDSVADTENYVNYPRTGTRGWGASFKFKNGSSRAELGYSMYSAFHNRVPEYAAADSAALLGFPRHKVTLNSSFSLSERLAISPSAIYLSERSGYCTAADIKKFNAAAFVNIYLSLRESLAKGLTLGFGVYNMFDSANKFLQPYASGHAPLPGGSREFALKAVYEF